MIVIPSCYWRMIYVHTGSILPNIDEIVRSSSNSVLDNNGRKIETM